LCENCGKRRAYFRLAGKYEALCVKCGKDFLQALDYLLAVAETWEA